MLKIKINNHEFTGNDFDDLIQDIYKAKNSDTTVSEFCKAFREYMQIELGTDRRICSHCGALMFQGYCIGDGEEYYCNDNCLHQHYTEDEYKQLYQDGYAYWTEWE